MHQESLGFVKLEWTCPKCGRRNPGPQKTCSGCGAPQPQDVSFEQAEHQELIQDQAEIKQAKAGPDIHCAFCGARNPAGSMACSQCGADLAQGVHREVGQVVGAFAAAAAPLKQIACPRCTALNPETALVCAQCGAPLTKTPMAAPAASAPAAASKPNTLWVIIGLAAAALCLCVMVFMLLRTFNTEGKNAIVQDVHWVSIISVEAQQPVRHKGWRNEIPEGATVGACTEEPHHLQDDPAPNSVKVCGTPYQVDTGSGFAEVVQDCQYEVYQEYCEYTEMVWQQVNEFRLEGEDYSPVWPVVQLGNEEREGDRSQVFTIVFETPEGQYEYTTSDYDLFSQLQIGSQWVLNINGLGQIVSIEPVR